MIPLDDDSDVLTGAALTPEQQRFLAFANLPDPLMRAGAQPDPTAMQQAQYFMSGNGGP